jgi:electron transport complex protein RnfD
MRQVMIALLPALVASVVLFGCGILVHLSISIFAAVSFEALALRWRNVEIRPYLADGSVLVLASLLAFAIPPYAPWWVTIVGVAMAVLIGKHAFGGLGQNVFNPAMVGYIFLLLCFPYTLNQWPAVGSVSDFRGLFDSVALVFLGAPDLIDGRSGATVLDQVKTQATLMRMTSEMDLSAVLGLVGGRGWEWVNAAFLSGGAWLLWRGVIRWRLPAGFLFGLGCAAVVGTIADPELHRGLLFHYFTGATMIAAFFIVTDPVSSPTSQRGMLLFGFGVGLCTYLIREFGSYPDGVAFAIVAMNSCAPLIDRLTQPRLYGTSGKSD